MAYSNVELRKLPPSFRFQLGQILDVNEGWKKVMSSIVNEMNPSIPKYTSEHIDLIERSSVLRKKAAGEILIDEWSTSGRVRPTVELLYELLLKAELYRAADYVAKEILEIPLPIRPTQGPAASVSTSSLQENEKISNNDSKENISKILNLNDFHINDNEVERDEKSEEGKLINFNIEILERGTEKWKECIGEGAFGKVYRFNNYAVKVLNPTTTDLEEHFVNEIRILSSYRHENLLSLIGFSTNGPQFALVYEFMPNGSLLKLLATKETKCEFNWPLKISVLKGVAEGINYLHIGTSKPLIHRDIKSANVLISQQYIAKIGDFGLAKCFGSGNQTSALTSTIFGTSAYMAPEAFRGDISPKMDVFSFGVIILEVLTGLSPYDDNREGGHDLVTFIEEAIGDDGDITQLLDEYIPDSTMFKELLYQLYVLATDCLEDKKRRPNSLIVLDKLKLIQDQAVRNQF